LDLIFPILVSLGVAVGHAVIVRSAKQDGLDVGRAHWMVFCIVATAFTAGAFAPIVYHPEFFEPGATIPFRPLGLSSFGGLLGAMAGAVIYVRAARMDRVTAWRYWNLVGYAFPFGWFFGRLACSIVHDHPGVRATGLFTHFFPDGRRYDLGRIELVVFVVPICAWFWWLRSSRRSRANFPALFLLLYAPFRLWLDLLRENPPRYAGVTVDQIGVLITLVLGVWMYRAYPTSPARRER